MRGRIVVEFGLTLAPFAGRLPREEAHDLDQRRRLAVISLLSILTASHSEAPKTD
jgi:hypothetical protein